MEDKKTLDTVKLFDENYLTKLKDKLMMNFFNRLSVPDDVDVLNEDVNSDTFDEELNDEFSNFTVTENGEFAFRSIGEKTLDFFGNINRDATTTKVVNSFMSSWNEDPELTLKVLFNFRDIRGGKGEKKISRTLMFVIKKIYPEIYEKILKEFVNLGYWKDLLYICEISKLYEMSTSVDFEVNMMANQLIQDLLTYNKNKKSKTPSSISLCAKWAPTEGTHFGKADLRLDKKISTKLELSPKEYRKMISLLRKELKTVEMSMSTQKFNEIEFGKLASKSHMLYRKAFLRGTNVEKTPSKRRTELKVRYEKYLDQLTREDTNVNVNFKGIQPHEIVTRIQKDKSGSELLEAQWKEIRNNIKKSGVFKDTVSVVDVSGSMHGSIGKNGPAPVDVAMALGILVSECCEGPWKEQVITFDNNPEFVNLRKFEKLVQKVNHVYNMKWGGSTNLEKTFDAILNLAVNNSVPKEDMVKKMFIFTDMQFNQITNNDNFKTFDKISNKYEKYGYKMPQIICWNLRTVSAVPFEIDDNGVCMLSGFSSELMKAVLNHSDLNETMSPRTIFMNAVGHYKIPKIENLENCKSMNLELIDLKKLETILKN